MEDFSKKCCANCKKCFIKDCEKLIEQNEEYAMLCSSELTKVGLFNEKFMKKKKIQEEFCCDDFKSIWIEYPLAVSSIEYENIDRNRAISCSKIGSLVAISPCGEEYKGKTFLGFYIGDLGSSLSSSYKNDTKVLSVSESTNPAFLVPELNKIIFGFESWWSEIKSIEDFKPISNSDIDAVWYVQLLKSGHGAEPETEKDFLPEVMRIMNIHNGDKFTIPSYKTDDALNHFQYRDNKLLQLLDNGHEHEVGGNGAIMSLIRGGFRRDDEEK